MEKECEHRVCYEDPEPYCLKCGDVFPPLMVHPYDEDSGVRYHHNYQAKDYWDRKMKLLLGVSYQGKQFYLSCEETQIWAKGKLTEAFRRDNKMTWNKLWRIWTASIPKNCKGFYPVNEKGEKSMWKQIPELDKFQGCFLYGKNEDFLCIPWIMDRIPPITKEVYNMAFHILFLDKFVQDNNLEFNQLYLLFKVMQLAHLNYQWIPLKIAAATFRKYDKSWKQWCNFYGFPYLRSKEWIVSL